MMSAALIGTIKLAAAIAVSAAVVTEDLRHRRIPTNLCILLLLTGLFSAAACRGWAGAVDGLLGAVAGFAAFLLPYGLGGMGGGDVKLMAGFGALTGVRGILPALILVAAAGVFTVIIYLICQSLRGRPASSSVPYAPAIVVGSLLVTISQIGGR